MKTTKILAILVLALGLIVCAPKVSKAAEMGTAFTYQGRLIDANSTADGEYDFEFKLFDANVAGTQQESTIDVDELDVVDGYFTVELDFGSGIFTGDARWLEIGVRPGELEDPNVYTTLSPRQELTPTPYAIYAKTAGSDNDWMVSGNNMYSIPSGKVGIGKTSPPFFSKLEVHSDGSQIRLTNDKTKEEYNDGFTMGQTCSTCEHVGLVNRENAPLSFWTNYTERMRIAADGKVGIGTITPKNTMDVGGSMAVGSGYAGSNTAPSNGMIIEGEVGIGTDAPGSKLHVHGGQIYVNYPGASGNHAIRVNNAGGHGVLVSNANSSGFYVAGTGGDGLYVADADDCGIDAIGDHGNHLRSYHTNYYGLYVHSWYDEADKPGLYVNGKTRTTGSVGIGIDPQRTLHVNNVMRLEPRAIAPSSPSEGDMYMNSSTHKLMVYDGSAWRACW